MTPFLSDVTLFWTAGLIGWLVTIWHAIRFARSWSGHGWPQRLLSIGFSLLLIGVASGLLARASDDRRLPFEWYHWIVLAAFAFVAGGYLGHARRGQKARRAARSTETQVVELTRAYSQLEAAHRDLVAFTEEFDDLDNRAPCDTPACIAIRASAPRRLERIASEMSAVENRLAALA